MQTIINETKIFPKLKLTKLHYKNLFANSRQSMSKWSAALKLESFYNSLVHYHHYLGYRQIVGNHLKYIAYIGDRPVACLGWGSAAWSVLSRDSFICWKPLSNKADLKFTR